MKTSVAFFCIVFTAHTLVADIYSAAMRQARNVAVGRQPGDNTPPQTPPAVPATPPPNPALEATLRNISSLRADLDALGKLSEVKAGSPEKKSLLDDLTVAAQGIKPSSASISKLADSLASALAGKKLSAAPSQKLAQDVHAIFNSSHLSADQQQMIFVEVQKILESGGVSPDKTADAVNRIKTIAAETE
ncbi:MAG TPA: hypothetical protein VIK59_00810 [Verrucomicrobiae bacterium]